jgi:hypothetical protein
MRLITNRESGWTPHERCRCIIVHHAVTPDAVRIHNPSGLHVHARVAPNGATCRAVNPPTREHHDELGRCGGYDARPGVDEKMAVRPRGRVVGRPHREVPRRYCDTAHRVRIPHHRRQVTPVQAPRGAEGGGQPRVITSAHRPALRGAPRGRGGGPRAALLAGSAERVPPSVLTPPLVNPPQDRSRTAHWVPRRARRRARRLRGLGVDSRHSTQGDPCDNRPGPDPLLHMMMP